MVTSVWVTSLVLLLASFENAESGSNENVGEPLLLTPLIKAGRLAEARHWAKVNRLLIHVNSYSGFLTVNETYNSNLFFWYFPAKANPATAPVLLYLEGGPDLTMMVSLFLENGPFSVSESFRLVPRSESWNNNHHVIYIENPIGTGYSFADDDAAYPDGQIQIGNDLLNALVQFFKMFPYLRTNDFFVTGRSYAGKHVPVVCNAIHNWNPTTRTDKINLKGMAISSGLTDPMNQLIFGEYLYNIGLLDENGKNEFLFRERRIQALILQHKHAEAFDVVQQLFGPSPNLLQNLTGYNAGDNILQTNIGLRICLAWVQSPQIRRALHVGNRNFVPYSTLGLDYLKDDFTRSQANLVANLLEHYRVLVYTGTLGTLINYPGVQNYLRNLNWTGTREWKTAKRKQWRVNGELAGWIKTVDNLSEVTVRLAGYYVHMDQPVWALELLEKFIRGQL